MRNTLIAVLVAALLATPLAGCVGDSLGPAEVVASGTPAQGNPQAVADPRLGDAINTFGFNLLRETRTGGYNTVVSPLSAHAALAMTYNGAIAETAGQMAGTLALLDMSQADTNQAYADLLASLDALPSDLGTVLNVENSLWADEGFKLHEAFAETDRRYFGAQLETLDLQADGTRDRINGWVAERTADKITELVDEIPLGAVIYLVNAVYLKGTWAVPFDPEQTEDGPFSIDLNEQFDVPLMRRGGHFMYAEVAGTQAVRLPYEDGRLAMWVMLPPLTNGNGRNAATREIDRLADGGWEKITTQATDRSGGLVMPRFASRSKSDLASALSAMGMPLAFDPAAADFSNMSPQGADLFISRVLHETYIAVDEQGTEAAAATVVEGQWAGAFEPPTDIKPFEMTVDRPFLFAIEDANSGALLFLGAIDDPR